MKRLRRRSPDWIMTAFRGAALLIAMIIAPHVCAAETYPTKAGRLILTFAAGGGTDTVARLFAAKYAEVTGQLLVVDNRPGAGGVIGTGVAAIAPSDGYTLLGYGLNQPMIAAQYKKLPYDHIRDFIPVSLYAAMPNILVVHPSVPAKSVQEFIALAKASPGNMKYASSGIGGTTHLTMEMFKSSTGVDLVHVPYKIAVQGVTDLLGGHLQAMFSNLPTQMPNIKAGRLRPIAVTSARRAEQLPDVPTVIESGVPGFEVSVWEGIAVPAGTPRPIVDKLHRLMMKVLASPDLKQRYFDQGATVAQMSAKEFTAFIAAETGKWAKVVKDANVTIE